MGNAACASPLTGSDALGSDEAQRQNGDEVVKAEAALAERLRRYEQEVAKGDPLWKSDAQRYAQVKEEEHAAAAAAAAADAERKAAAEAEAAVAAAAAAAVQAVAQAADAGAGVWGDGEKHEDGKKKTEEKKKKKAEGTVKKRKEEPKETKAKSEESLKAAIAEREKAWAKKPQKEKEDLSKKMFAAVVQGLGVEALLEQGCSVNCEDGDGWTPLIKAADVGDRAVVELLLKQGANAKAAVKLGEYGQTALHFAARHGKQEIAELLAPVSNLKAKNHIQKTPREVANAEGHKDLAKWLRVQEKAAGQTAEKPV